MDKNAGTQKHPGGRPTKYKPEYCDMVIEHFQVPTQAVRYKRTYAKDGSIISEEEIPVATEFPTFQKFADSLDVSMSTLQQWMVDYPEFSVAYARAKELQEHIWLVNGMQNLYNAQFAQFFGKNCLGYKDKQEVDAKIDAEITIKLEGDVSEWSK